MKILLLSFYYPPDLCAGSFRCKALVDALTKANQTNLEIEVFTTHPNRYHEYKIEPMANEQDQNIKLTRVQLPSHNSDFVGQAKAFKKFYSHAIKHAKKNRYDAVVATSSRLFTAFLGARIAKKQRIPLILDIRDIFVDTMNDLLQKRVQKPVLKLFKKVEAYTMKSANYINVVSPAFLPYFQTYTNLSPCSVFTNGIDDEFTEHHFSARQTTDTSLTLTYAGNMGQGQGLHALFPEIANSLPQINFQLCGAGGQLKELQEKTNHLSNVNLMAPVKRDQLIPLYQQSDILFLHLNNHNAFKKVLPSKIFEYAATGKTIVAGVSGEAKRFLEEEVKDGVHVFEPCDKDACINILNQLSQSDSLPHYPREAFVQKYMRTNIMDNFVERILSTLHLQEEVV
jgi:glycosyltransferase involved in cell wall biosynthesis